MSNVCICPKPPGGKVICSDDQLAMCGYQNGEITSGCFDRPGAIHAIMDQKEKNLAVANWVLSKITGVDRSTYEPIEPGLVGLLRSGEYRDAVTGSVLRFGLPKDLELEFPQAASASY